MYDSMKMENIQPLDSMILNFSFELVLKRYKYDTY
jgi:hypothetical protein